MLSFNDNSEIYVQGCYASGSEGSYPVDGNACSALSVTTSDVTGIDVQMPLVQMSDVQSSVTVRVWQRLDGADEVESRHPSRPGA